MEREGLAWTHRACSTVLQAFGKAGRLNAALQLIGEMEQRGISPDHIDYLTLIGACARGKKNGTRAGDRGGSEQALELLQRMQDKGPVPDIRHYTAAMKVCVTEGDSAKAVNIFRSMRDQGIKPNAHSWGALLDAIGKAGQVAEMMAWYGEMLASGGVKPNIIMMTTLLDNAGKAGEPGIVERIWRDMLDRQLEPDVKSYNTRISCYATANQPDQAEGVLAEMCQSAAVKPNAFCFNSLMQAYINDKRLDEAERIIGRMRAAGVEPDFCTWRVIIHAADELGDIKKADGLYCDALSSKAINPYRPQLSNAIKDPVGSTLPVGTVHVLVAPCVADGSTQAG
ncbi:hypothetical protein JKP88DRAFT_317281 [Tribonema minus]|uniref:Pentatricopeptide repeat-containing protein n=1 Tax=Tribonema minus TaxID=303371 RepID=A0A835Z5Z3_9STRA|nr:hypothetical protein JKP88DRAFT_317281 [Tribonema minus]